MANLFQRWFRNKPNSVEIHGQNHYDSVCLFDIKMRELFTSDQYLNKRSTHPLLLETKEAYDFFLPLHMTKTLPKLCRQNGWVEDIISSFLYLHQNIDSQLKNHNEEFLTRHLFVDKEYLDRILYDVDPHIVLDEDQRRVVLNEEDHCLVVAGAGAGKTTTVAAKVKYLVDRKNIDPKQILIISYTNKAVDELRDRINKQLKLDCPITTFHSTGNAIIRKNNEFDKTRVFGGGYLYTVVRDYFTNVICNHPSDLKNLILFFGYYITAPFEGDDLQKFFDYAERSDFSTLKGNLGNINKTIIDARTKRKITIRNEVVRSFQEVQIANFLFLNGIEYEYEPIYPYHIEGASRVYTPDFIIRQNGKEAYIEHFGITESGKNNRYTPIQLQQYQKSMYDKQAIHHKHRTTLISTFSQYNDNRSLIEHLHDELVRYGFELTSKKDEEIFQIMAAKEENRYLYRIIELVSRFIIMFKTEGYQEDGFDTLRTKTTNVRTMLFLDIVQKAYLEYQKKLKENNGVDFEDMINESARILRECREMKKKLDFKYIIVDEYQDISVQRFQLTRELAKVTDARIMAVGDDWQSIYAFAGSNISLFTHFIDEMGDGILLKINNTYRNAQEVIDIAGKFIQKTLVSNKHIQSPVFIYVYSDDFEKNETKGVQGIMEERGKLLESVLDKIVQHGGLKKSVLLLGRYGFDAEQLGKTSYFTYHSESKTIKSVKHPNLNLSFLTVHSSKGLGYDNVILINAIDAVFGFPSQIEDDPILNLVVHGDRNYAFAEERRLFYVALTRTKERVFILAPKRKPSQFVREIIDDNPETVKIRGEFETAPDGAKKGRTLCPICGYPLQLRVNPHFQMKLYTCTNEPEICDFMTNDLHGGVKPIHRCSKCTDGYMIVNKNKEEENYFFGCTNFKHDRTGCNNTERILN